MATFSEVNQAKLSLKMNLSNYCWYNSIAIMPDADDWCLLVNVDRMDNNIRKVIPIVHKGVSVKVDVVAKQKRR